MTSFPQKNAFVFESMSEIRERDERRTDKRILLYNVVVYFGGKSVKLIFVFRAIMTIYCIGRECGRAKTL